MSISGRNALAAFIDKKALACLQKLSMPQHAPLLCEGVCSATSQVRALTATDRMPTVCVQECAAQATCAASQRAGCGAQDVDKVELVYTKFVSLISSEPIIQTLLPLTPQARPLAAHCVPQRLQLLNVGRQASGAVL